jgi:hypothetical protein
MNNDDKAAMPYFGCSSGIAGTLQLLRKDKHF